MILDKMTKINLEALWKEQVAKSIENSKYANADISPHIECMEEGLIYIGNDDNYPTQNHFYKKIFQSPSPSTLPMPSLKWIKN